MLPPRLNHDYLTCRLMTDRISFGQWYMPQLIAWRRQTVNKAHQLITLLGGEAVCPLHQSAGFAAGAPYGVDAEELAAGRILGPSEGDLQRVGEGAELGQRRRDDVLFFFEPIQPSVLDAMIASGRISGAFGDGPQAEAQLGSALSHEPREIVSGQDVRVICGVHLLLRGHVGVVVVPLRRVGLPGG